MITFWSIDSSIWNSSREFADVVIELFMMDNHVVAEDGEQNRSTEVSGWSQQFRSL